MKNKSPIDSAGVTPANTKNMEMTLEEALDRAGAGKYQLFHCALMWAALASSLQEMIGYQFVLPAAACDLDLPEGLRGLVTSIPNLGIIVTAPFWGRAADRLGRKPVMLGTCAAAGAISLAASLMPTLTSFALVKVAGSLFLSAPSSLSYAYAGEMVPQRRRDFAILMCNGFLTVSSTLSPLIGWAVLSADWHYQLGALALRPWRLLSAVYASLMIFTALWMTQAKESPKFLLAKGRAAESLAVLTHVYTRNTGAHPDSYGVLSLKSESEEPEVESGSEMPLSAPRKESAWALLRPPHLKWFTLTAFLMFGLYTLLNGIFLFATDTINKVLKDPSGETGTLCVLINQPNNETISTSCDDSISQDTFRIMSASTAIYAVVVVAASASHLSKKTLLIGMYLVTGTATLIAGLGTNKVVAGAAMSAMQISSLGIGPLTAYAVELFPTCLRGTAVGAVMMFGRTGSVAGATLAGYLLPFACTPTFYGFAALVYFCAALSFLLPSDRTATNRSS